MKTLSLEEGQEYYEDHFEDGKTWAFIAAEAGKSLEAVKSCAKRYKKWLESNHVAPEFTDSQGLQEAEELTLDEFVSLARSNQRAVNSVDPIVTHTTVDLKVDMPIGIIFVSCMHLGSRYVNHADFQELLDKVLEIPRLYWCALGDDTEGFTGFFNARSAHEQALADPKVQRKMLSLVLDKLAAKDKLLAGFSSQHGSQWVEARVAEDPIKAMYTSRGVPYFDGQGYITVKVGSESYKIFAAHELPGSSVLSRNAAQKKAATVKAPGADVVVSGDKHTYAVQHTAVDSWELDQPQYQWLLQVGTSKDGPDPYTIRTWSQGKWNWPMLVFRPDRHEIAQAADLKLLQMMLNRW